MLPSQQTRVSSDLSVWIWQGAMHIEAIMHHHLGGQMSPCFVAADGLNTFAAPTAILWGCRAHLFAMTTPRPHKHETHALD